jgi:hypothetical protein
MVKKKCRDTGEKILLLCIENLKCALNKWGLPSKCGENAQEAPQNEKPMRRLTLPILWVPRSTLLTFLSSNVVCSLLLDVVVIRVGVPQFSVSAALERQSPTAETDRRSRQQSAVAARAVGRSAVPSTFYALNSIRSIAIESS